MKTNRWKAAREKRGLKVLDVVVAMRDPEDGLPKKFWVSPSWISRLENDASNLDRRPVVLAWLANFYEVELAELDLAAWEELEAHREFVSHLVERGSRRVDVLAGAVAA